MRYTFAEGVPQTLPFNKPPVSITCIFEAKLIKSNSLKHNFFLGNYAVYRRYPYYNKLKVNNMKDDEKCN